MHEQGLGYPSLPCMNRLVGAQGRYKSVMVAVSPCRSDMSRRGLAPWAHLADGRLTLVLVRDCSILQYLRFLTSIPRFGAPPAALVLPTTQGFMSAHAGGLCVMASSCSTCA